MAKRTNRVAWGLAAVLAVVLVVGFGVMLKHGVTVGDADVHVRSTDRWTTGTTQRISCFFGIASSTTTATNLGFLALDLTRTY